MAEPTPQQLLAGQVYRRTAQLNAALREAEAGGLRMDVHVSSGLFVQHPMQIQILCFLVMRIDGVVPHE